MSTSSTELEFNEQLFNSVTGQRAQKDNRNGENAVLERASCRTHHLFRDEMKIQNSIEKPLTSASSTGRRSFVGFVIALIWTAITGTIGTLAARFVAAPSASSMLPLNWAEIERFKDIPDGNPTKREVVVKQDSGWAHFNSARSVWIVRHDREVTVFSATCPHLGCTVEASGPGFVCPCHGSAWNADGDKLSGPTPRDLDLLESRIEGDTLKVRYQDFRQGSSQKESI